MKNFLRQEDIELVENRLKEFERNSGCELLLIIKDSSDPYPAASWRFGIISAFIISLIFTYYFEFHHAFLWPLSFFGIVLFMTWVGHFNWAKKITLADWEVERECHEKALELFHTLGASQVSHKVTAMIFISILERRIEVLVDEKLKSRINSSELTELVNIMKTHFASHQMSIGLIKSIDTLEKKILKDFGGKVTDINPAELKDTIHFLP